MNRIITGSDIAKRDGMESYGEWLRKRSVELARRGVIGKAMTPPLTPPPKGVGVIQARIDFGRWIGDCECGGAEYVDPQDPIFFCLSCGNRAVNGEVRLVVFPEDREAVEKEVLAIEVDERRGGNAIEQAMMARGNEGRNRCWDPPPDPSPKYKEGEKIGR